MRAFVMVGVVLAVARMAIGCEESVCADSRSCPGADGDGGASDAGPDIPGCSNLAASPREATCVVDERLGVFVSPSGKNGADGTTGDPLRTITEGMVKAKGAGKRVYVCAGTYDETLVVDAALDGAEVFGGLACDTWTWGASQQVAVAPSAQGNALEVRDVHGARFEDVTWAAKGGASHGESSVAVLVARSQNVVIRGGAMTAGDGADGDSGGPIADYAPAKSSDGNGGTASNGGGQQQVVCTNGSGTTTGGAGGPPSAAGASGISGLPKISPILPAGASGDGGTSGSDCVAGVGRNGSYGPAGTGGKGASVWGTLSADGWAPSNGEPGGIGGVGQGGGGGASQDETGGGGGGGAGGCGGTGGHEGEGGGSSIALLVFQSTVSLDGTALTVGKGGKGGSGGAGQKAQLGGNPGSNHAASCNGGAGGHGGSGGGGGGGAGGLSAGILWSGSPPRINGQDVTNAETRDGITPGEPGHGGAGGAGGPSARTLAPASFAGEEGEAGKEGIARAVLGI